MEVDGWDIESVIEVLRGGIINSVGGVVLRAVLQPPRNIPKKIITNVVLRRGFSNMDGNKDAWLR